MPKNKSKEPIMELRHPDSRKNEPVCPVSGSRDKEYLYVLANQLIQTLWLANSDKETASKKKYAAITAMMGIAPRDEVEGMLAAQMVSIHNASMECLRRAMIGEQTFEGRESNLSQANKLSRTYTMQMEALNRYRGKGQQKMTVEHVHVHAGGQAIVGNVTHPEGGGVQKKTEEQPHAKTITHAPEQALPRQNQKRKAVPVPRNA